MFVGERPQVRFVGSGNLLEPESGQSSGEPQAILSVGLVVCNLRLRDPAQNRCMKRKPFVSWMVTMLLSLGTFAGVLTAVGTLGVHTASTAAAPALSTATPVALSASSSSTASLVSKTPVSLTSSHARGRDDSPSTRGSSASRSSFFAGQDS